jgi:lysozyme family protein
MKESREKGLEIILGFEDPGLTGEITVDAGGRTRYGIAEKYNPNAWKNGPPSLDDAKQIYIDSYWIPGGCDSLVYPLDIAMFNCMVNPGSGAAQTISANNHTLDSFLRAQIRWYCNQVGDHPNLLQYLRGWILRVLNLWRMLET